MRFETHRSRSFRWGLVLVLLAAVFTSTWFVRAPGRAGLEKSSVLADEEEMEWFTAEPWAGSTPTPDPADLATPSDP